MDLEGLDFADGWRRPAAMIGLEKGDLPFTSLLKLVLAIAGGHPVNHHRDHPALLSLSRCDCSGGRRAREWDGMLRQSVLQ